MLPYALLYLNLLTMLLTLLIHSIVFKANLEKTTSSNSDQKLKKKTTSNYLTFDKLIAQGKNCLDKEDLELRHKSLQMPSPEFAPPSKDRPLHAEPSCGREHGLQHQLGIPLVWLLK